MDGTAVVLTTLLTSVLAAGGSVYMVERYNMMGLRPPAAAEAVVPEMHGMTEADARSSATTAHLIVFVSAHEASADVRPGAVLRQSVVAGHRVPAESTVSVVLADEPVKVPNVAGVPLPDAVQRLEERGYSVYVGPGLSDPKVPEGVVVRQIPKADVVYGKPAIVVVQASSGTGDVEVPKLLGMGVGTAKTKLEEIGLKVAVRWVAMAETQTNVVLSQKPPTGERVKPGSEVQITACTP